MKKTGSIKLAQDIENNSLDRLILKYSLPAIMSGLISALYNIIDQIFIGQIEGVLGNAATNVAFPLVTLTTSVALLFGIGGNANFSIALGRGEIDKAKKFIGTVLVCIPIISVLASIIVFVFAENIITVFGATEENFDLALTYTKIVALGYPFSMITMAFSHIIRGDGSPRYSMICTMSGAILNCILNPILMIGFDMGIAGAALATVLGQMTSFIMVVWYLARFKTFKITREVLKINIIDIKNTVSLGVASAVNQLSMTVMQIALNNSLTYYGGLSAYGADIPLACAGIISKVNMIYMMIMVGIAQGTQPIIGYNYGAKNYSIVMECYKKCIKYGSIFSVLAFISFQIFPSQIISIFGDGNELYYEFGIMYFKVFMFMTFLNGIQPITGNFFTAIGKPIKGAIISFTKQILFLTPLVTLLPIKFGLDGILFAGPIADTMAFTMAVVFMYFQFKELRIMEKNKLN